MRDPEVRLEAAEVGVGMSLVSCRLNDHRCWTIRTDKNNAGLGGHPLTVVEVVAPVHLRTELRLEESDEVSLHVAR